MRERSWRSPLMWWLPGLMPPAYLVKLMDMATGSWSCAASATSKSTSAQPPLEALLHQ
jgi:hypothetical protein